MTVLFDTSTLLLALQPGARPPLDPDTNLPLEHAKQRVEFLIKTLSKNKTKVIIPAPVLAEVLVHAGDAANDYVQILQTSPFRVAPFDTRAAIECADAITRFGLKAKGKENTRAKIKFDRQIVAIARVEQAIRDHSDQPRLHASVRQGAAAGGRQYSHTVYADAANQPVVEQWLLHGAGHAWSGGSPHGSFTDLGGPDALAEMIRFFYSQPRAGTA